MAEVAAGRRRTRLVALGVVLSLGSLRTTVQAQVPVVPTGADAAATGVRPGDIIRVWVWREKELSGEFPVDSRGRVVLPLIGEHSVNGVGAERLGDSLRVLLRQFITNPSIEITVLRRISVQGHVAKPGFYPVDATVNVAGVIALAGGVSASGDARRIRLVRGGQVIVKQIAADAVVERSPLQSGDELLVPERGFFARNGVALLWIVASSAATLLVTVLTR